MTDALIDTSVLIATDTRRELRLPDAAAISVITLGELRAGVELARDAAVRALRSRRLAAVRTAFSRSTSTPRSQTRTGWCLPSRDEKDGGRR